jgi:hypothetical protein
MKKIAGLLIFIALVVASLCHTKNNFKIEYSKADLTAYQIQNRITEKLCKRHQMQFIGNSAEMPDNDIRSLGLIFQITRPLSKDEARLILIDCVQEILNAINSNEEIRPYLNSYPFTPKNVEITIFIKDSQARDLFDPDLGVVHAYKGKLDYITYVKGNKFYKHQSETEETYEEALERASHH